MGNIFRKGKNSKISIHDKAVLQLKQQRDKLRQYQVRVESSLEKDRILAKSLITAGKKDRALLLLRKKRYLETLLRNADKQLQNIEQLASDLEFAQVESEVVHGLRVGNQALKDINATMSIDEIEQILEETQEAVNKQAEIDALLSGVLTKADEQDVLDELDQLVQEEADEQPVVKRAKDELLEDDELALPDVPHQTIRVPKPVARELEALEA